VVKRDPERAIRTTCTGAGTTALEEVHGIQGNLKTINRKNLEKLKGRILKHGFNVPYHVWIDKEGRRNLLDGHQRTRALLELQAAGYAVPPLPYDIIEAKDLADAKDKLLGIASQYGEFTMEGLRDFTQGMEIDSDIRLTSGEIRLENIRGEEDLGDDDAPEAAPKIAKAGDLWDLGPHRLKVGDSTAKEEVAALFQEDLAQLVFTDPPYGVDYDDAERGGHNGGIMNDEKKGLELEKQLLAPAFKLAAKNAVEDAAFYIWHASATREHFARALKAAGLEERQYLVWVKPTIVMGRAHYHWAHEPCFYAGKAGITPRWAGDRRQSTVWQVTLRREGTAYVQLAQGVTLTDADGSQIHLTRDPPKGKKDRSVRVEPGETTLVSSLDGSDVWEIAPDSKKDYVHPNQKPVDLALRAIINNTEPGEVVYDAFAGSGSTLIACQRAQRCFRGMELDRHFADLIIKRWCLWMFNHHLEPTLTRNGKPFEWQKFCPELAG
jgi:DNA modification methylase